MEVIVSRIYSNGKRIPSKKKLATHKGALNMADGKHPIIGRLCAVAVLFNDDGLLELPSLYDTVLNCIAANGFRLRGFEVQGGRETAQEWWVQVPNK